MTLTASDLATIEQNITVLIADHPLQAAFRRGTSTLPAQTVRVVASGKGNRRETDAAASSHWPLTLLGNKALDVQPGDRFNDYSGQLCVVKTVHPDRRAFTQAGVDLVQ